MRSIHSNFSIPTPGHPPFLHKANPHLAISNLLPRGVLRSAECPHKNELDDVRVQKQELGSAVFL